MGTWLRVDLVVVIPNIDWDDKLYSSFRNPDWKLTDYKVDFPKKMVIPMMVVW
jgi:hypothetical protein